MGEIVTVHIRSEENVADLCTKVIPGGAKRQFLTSLVLYDVCDFELPPGGGEAAS